MLEHRSSLVLPAFVGIALLLSAPAEAAKVKVNVKVENLAPVNSVSFAPLRFGFNKGTFDAFNSGAVATAPIISVAEGGSGSAWLPAFAAADPKAVIGSTAGPLFPGASQNLSFLVDTVQNPYFTFAAMVIPSNDFFIGNDDPMEYRLFDSAGKLLISSIGQTAGDIWNAGSEAFDPKNAAFLVGGNNALRTPEHGVVGLNFSELSGFDGLTTAAGYVFHSGLSAGTDVYRISFTSTGVPEPETWSLMIAGFATIGMVARRRARRPGMALNPAT